MHTIGKRTSRTATASDFTATTSSIAAAVTVPADRETAKPAPNTVVDTSREAVNRHLKALDSSVKTMKKGFLGIACGLRWFKDTMAYQRIGDREYPTIEAFARDRYDISRSTTFAYIAVVEKFGKVNPETGDIDELMEEYRDYSPTALITMCAMDEETLAKCKPNMKVKDLKALISARDEDEEDNGGDSTGSDPGSGDGDDPDGDSGDGGINAASDSSIKGVCLLHVNTVEEFENRKEYILDVMKKILTQNTAADYTVGIYQLFPPEPAG